VRRVQRTLDLPSYPVDGMWCRPLRRIDESSPLDTELGQRVQRVQAGRVVEDDDSDVPRAPHGGDLIGLDGPGRVTLRSVTLRVSSAGSDPRRLALAQLHAARVGVGRAARDRAYGESS
jgi:hypothetical protein